MTSQADGSVPEHGRVGPLGAAADIAPVAGAAGCLFFTFRVGHRNSSVVLMSLFAIWVLSPFVGLFAANLVASRWTVRSRALIYGVGLALTVGSLAIYGAVALGPPRPKPAAYFLLVPLASWLMIAAVTAIGWLVSGRPSRQPYRR